MGDRNHDVTLTHDHEGLLEATVDGRRYLLSVSEPQPNVYSMLVDGLSHEAVVQNYRDGWRVRIGPAIFEVVADDPGRPGRLRAGHGDSVIVAVMPGRVLRVLVTPGESVSARQGLVVLEAMKMENEIGAPRDATIAAVRVSPGDTVETGDPLVVLE